VKYIIFKDIEDEWVILREDQLRYINYTDKYLMILGCDAQIQYIRLLTSLYTYDKAMMMISDIAYSDS